MSWIGWMRDDDELAPCDLSVTLAAGSNSTSVVIVISDVINSSSSSGGERFVDCFSILDMGSIVTSLQHSLANRNNSIVSNLLFNWSNSCDPRCQKCWTNLIVLRRHPRAGSPTSILHLVTWCIIFAAMDRNTQLVIKSKMADCRHFENRLTRYLPVCFTNFN